MKRNLIRSLSVGLAVKGATSAFNYGYSQVTVAPPPKADDPRRSLLDTVAYQVGVTSVRAIVTVLVTRQLTKPAQLPEAP